jgi:hypothetical protein
MSSLLLLPSPTAAATASDVHLKRKKRKRRRLFSKNDFHFHQDFFAPFSKPDPFSDKNVKLRSKDYVAIAPETINFTLNF